jgi:hypothetical protein
MEKIKTCAQALAFCIAITAACAMLLVLSGCGGGSGGSSHKSASDDKAAAAATNSTASATGTTVTPQKPTTTPTDETDGSGNTALITANNDGNYSLTAYFQQVKAGMDAGGQFEIDVQCGQESSDYIASHESSNPKSYINYSLLVGMGGTRTTVSLFQQADTALYDGVATFSPDDYADATVNDTGSGNTLLLQTLRAIAQYMAGGDRGWTQTFCTSNGLAYGCQKGETATEDATTTSALKVGDVVGDIAVATECKSWEAAIFVFNPPVNPSAPDIDNTPNTDASNYTPVTPTKTLGSVLK